MAASPKALLLAGNIRTPWATKVGLPGDEVQNIVQTRDGHLGLQAEVGLAGFDGVLFTQFRSLPGVPSAAEHGLCVTADNFTAPSFAVQQELAFRAKLEDIDRDRVDVSARRETIYASLDPKSSRFDVAGCDSDGVWHEAAGTSEFRDLPAFYQTWWFLVLCIAASVSMLWALYQLRLRVLNQALQSRYEERFAERTRIARELHDTLLQDLAGASLQLAAISKTMAAVPRAQTEVQKVSQQLDASFRVVRQKVWDLRSTALGGTNLPAALRESLEATANGLKGLCLTVTGEPRPLQPHMEEQLLRIGRECVANALRHAQASQILVELIFEAQGIKLCVSDNGNGFDIEAAARREGHWGLRSMQERAKEIGAQWKIDSSPGRGTKIETFIPSSTSEKK